MSGALIPAWENGQLVPVDKLEVHQRGLKHKAISIFVTEGARVLLQRRALGKYHTPGLWTNTCCTHPHWDEDDQSCATRRLREELGITGLPLTHVAEIEYRADVGGGLIEHEVVQVFTAQAMADLTVIPNPDEVAATDWISLQALPAIVERSPDRFTPWLRIYLRDHADRIFSPAAECAGNR
ncbi:isopentenyl-diphosphate Delta-isomerase [Roseinatronobacter sp. S2]|uniref:isopentenyl-diphosphate Delta-isomerase n=1 Tax=Roseinatronobacter sp. S2 TaxID=3035471 RepID=UPI00240EB6F2|nr:isopentenyl-diphosphate Delta-isomerase [Roseinatronobacter sp. S2]WFE76780.1 isopentenyl-diphosphate Delta-isomerase [Roseinatronobacter sp. S2]